MTLNEVLPIILYILGSILLGILIVLGIKLITVMNKMEKVVDDINTKVSSLNGVFSIIDATTDKLALLSDRMVDGISLIIRKLFAKKNKKNKEKETDDNE